MAALLEGIRVLDLTRILAGPWATQNLADMGAEVIKIERPHCGDESRTFGPPFLRDKETGKELDAAYYLSCNRGKKSVAVDISTPEGQELILKLAEKCDVIIENYKVNGLKKYGLDYESIKNRLPNIVYCSVTGFGQTGPYAERAGYDYLLQAMGGLMSVTGEPDNKPGGGPQKIGVAVIDIFAGMYAALAILAALRHRDHGGGGQHIDIGMLDVSVGILVNQAMNYFVTGKAPQRMGRSHPNITPYEWYHASDGHVLFAVGNDNQFARMCRAMERPELAADERFATLSARVANRDALGAILAEIVAQKTIDEWVSLMEDAEVPCGPINTIDRVFADPQVIARNMALQLDHPVFGKVPTIANPMRFSQTPITYNAAPPVVGQHTEQVLREILNLDEEQIQSLAGKGAVEKV